MKVFNHVFYTWLLAHFLHPIIFFVYFSLLHNDLFEVGSIISLFVAAFIISAPSLFISFLLIRFILRLRSNLVTSTIMWLFVAVGSIAVNILALSLLLGEDLLSSEWEFIIPSIIATLLSISLRFPLFQNLIRQNNFYEDQDDTASSYGS